METTVLYLILQLSISADNVPFAVLAISVLLVFVLSPTLILLLYPMRSFQRYLGYCTRIRWQFLHTFANAFQGCYKNGTNGSRDCCYHMKKFEDINMYSHLLAPSLDIGKMYVETFYSFICSSLCTKSTSLPPDEILVDI